MGILNFLLRGAMIAKDIGLLFAYLKARSRATCWCVIAVTTDGVYDLSIYG